MKQRIFLTAIAAAVAGLSSAPVFSQGNEAAQVIFTNDKLTVIDAKGVERAVKQGDFIQPGERVLTPPGVIGQIKLPDGTLLGARPGTDLKLESILKTLGKNVLVLNEGNVRVVNIAPPTGPKPMPMDIVSPISTMHMTAGDGETMHVKSGSKSDGTSGAEPGTYNRLQLGNALVRNDKGELPLPPMQPVFGSRLGVPLQPIAFLPISLVRIESVQLANPQLSQSFNPALVGNLRSFGPAFSPSVQGPLGDSPFKLSMGTANPSGISNAAYSRELTPGYAKINPNLIIVGRLQPPPQQIKPPPKIIKKFP